jgi:hypothetical protein
MSVILEAAVPLDLVVLSVSIPWLPWLLDRQLRYRISPCELESIEPRLVSLAPAVSVSSAGFKSTTLHDTFVNMAWIWMLTNNFDVEWVEMDPLWK